MFARVSMRTVIYRRDTVCMRLYVTALGKSNFTTPVRIKIKDTEMLIH